MDLLRGSQWQQCDHPSPLGGAAAVAISLLLLLFLLFCLLKLVLTGFQLSK